MVRKKAQLTSSKPRAQAKPLRTSGDYVRASVPATGVPLIEVYGPRHDRLRSVSHSPPGMHLPGPIVERVSPIWPSAFQLFRKLAAQRILGRRGAPAFRRSAA